MDCLSILLGPLLNTLSYLSLCCSKKSATNVHFLQSGGVKISKIFWPFDSPLRDLLVILYISSVPNFSNFNLDCFKYDL